jgi:biotin carboxyl carrier protein
MHYNLMIQEETTTLGVTQNEDGSIAIATPDKHLAVTCRRIDDCHLFVTIDGVGYNAFVSGDGHTRQVVIDGVHYRVVDADAQARLTAAGAAPQALPREVTPPMPAVVVKIMAAEGQRVTAGAGLVVVSAMKMETTLTAPFDARVVRVNVAEGDKVMPGDILVDLEAEEAEDAAES